MVVREICRETNEQIYRSFLQMKSNQIDPVAPSEKKEFWALAPIPLTTGSNDVATASSPFQRTIVVSFDPEENK